MSILPIARTKVITKSCQRSVLDHEGKARGYYCSDEAQLEGMWDCPRRPLCNVQVHYRHMDSGRFFSVPDITITPTRSLPVCHKTGV